MEKLKDIISSRRKELRMTQKDLAERLNVSDKVISKWETGTSYPDLTIINALAKELEIPITKLLDLPELTKPIEAEKVDDKLIVKYKTNFIISMTILIVSLIMFVIIATHQIEDDTLNFIAFFIFLITTIGSIVYYFINNMKFRNEYTKHFVREPYDLLYYKYNLVTLDLMKVIIFILPLILIQMSKAILILNIVLIVVFSLFKYKLIANSRFKYKNKLHLAITIVLEVIATSLLFIIGMAGNARIMDKFLGIILYIILGSPSYYFFKYQND